MQNIGSASKERSGLLPCARLERCEDREDREARERSRSCYVLERALEDARVETLRRRDRAVCTDAVSASGLGRLAELQYAAREGFAVWSCVPRWLRAAIHGNDGNHGPYGDATVTTRDRGVDVVGLRDGRLVLAQVKWYREGACVSGDADMKLALIGATAQRGCADMGLLAPPVTVLVVRRGARTARSSPGTETIEYVELTDADLGLDGPRGPRSCRRRTPSLGATASQRRPWSLAASCPRRRERRTRRPTRLFGVLSLWRPWRP